MISRFTVISAVAAFGTVILVALIVYRVIAGAWPAIQAFGLSFVWDQAWDPVKSQFGALDFLYGTAVTAFCATLIAAPLAIAIALYLTELAPSAARGVIGSLIEMLAAVPSVVLGLWGIFVLGPFLHDHVEPFLHSSLGFIPLFAAAETGRRRHVHRDPDPDDHDRPDHRQRQPRALQERSRQI